MGKKFLSFLKFFLPFLLWLTLFKPQFSGQVMVGTESFVIFSVVKFFLDNLALGVVPMWNPYIVLGHSTQVMLSYLGAGNPLWLVTLGLNSLGVQPYWAFVATMVGYFWLGMAGFYLLSLMVLKEERSAYLAFLLLLFSSCSLEHFPQFHLTLIFVPAVWFFYFAVRFFTTPARRFFVGMTFALIVVLSGYVPFYFLTLLLFVALSWPLCFWKEFQEASRVLAHFVSKNPFVTVGCLVALGIAFLPGWAAYQVVVSHQLIAPMHSTTSDIFTRGVTVSSYKDATDGCLSARMFLEDLWNHLDQIQYWNQGFFYLSLFAYLVLLLGVLIKVNRRMIFFLGLSAALLLLSLANATPFHRFLFEYIPFFRLFRNLFFLLPFLAATVALLVGEIFRILLAVENFSQRQRWLRLGALALLHVLVLVFLLKQDAVIPASYAAVWASFIFWTLLTFWPQLLTRNIFWVLLLGVVIIQPAAVLAGFNQQCDEQNEFMKSAAPSPRARPTFLYVRPNAEPSAWPASVGHHLNCRHRLTMTDAAGFYQKDYLAYWTYYLSRQLPEETFRRYWQNKFLLYDSVELFDESVADLKKAVAGVRDGIGTAFVPEEGKRVTQDLAVFLARPAAGARPPKVIQQGEKSFVVKEFAVNELTLNTDLAQEQFLVYNDSFHKDWQAFIDGNRVPLYRANIAFKGLKVPAGPHRVTLRFAPPGGRWVYLISLISNGLVFLILFGLFIPRRKQEASRG